MKCKRTWLSVLLVLAGSLAAHAGNSQRQNILFIFTDDHACQAISAYGSKISLVPILKGETPADWRKSFYYHYYEGPSNSHAVAKHYGVVTSKHKLVHYYSSGEWDLFDLEIDPHELQSVYDDPDYSDIVKDFKEELARLRSDLKVPEKAPYPKTGSRDSAFR